MRVHQHRACCGVSRRRVTGACAASTGPGTIADVLTWRPMGGTSMRGYINDQFRGDLFVGGNLEYSLPLIGLFGLSIRGLAFVDSGYCAFFTHSDERTYLPQSNYDSHTVRSPFRNSVGVGTRLYLRQIVLPLLGVDVGYGLEVGDVQVYLAIGLTD